MYKSYTRVKKKKRSGVYGQTDGPWMDGQPENIMLLAPFRDVGIKIKITRATTAMCEYIGHDNCNSFAWMCMQAILFLWSSPWKAWFLDICKKLMQFLFRGWRIFVQGIIYMYSFTLHLFPSPSKKRRPPPPPPHTHTHTPHFLILT